MNFQLNNSKTLWGFGIAIALIIVRKILETNGMIIPDSEWDIIVQAVSLIAAWFGVYGVRDAIRKTQIQNYLTPKEETKN